MSTDEHMFEFKPRSSCLMRWNWTWENQKNRWLRLFQKVGHVFFIRLHQPGMITGLKPGTSLMDDLGLEVAMFWI